MATLSRFRLYAGCSVAATAWAVRQAFDCSPNFYSAMVFLSRSSHSILILANFALLMGYLIGRAMQYVMFGRLRMIEIEHLHERAWFAITETALALTIFRDDFSASILANLVGLLWLKCWHWIATDRVEWIDQTLNLPRFFHPRLLISISTLLLMDCGMVYSCWNSVFGTRGSPMMLMFAFEYALLVFSALGSLARYGLSIYEIKYHGGSEAHDESGNGGWENKSVAILYLSLALDLMRLSLYITLFVVLLSYYGLPLHLLRDIYVCLRSVLIKTRDLARYKAATADMDRRYPIARAEELGRTDGICIICREEMTLSVPRLAPEQAEQRRAINDSPRKLMCGHIFHLRCLRAWLERQQSCPTCRRTVLAPNAQPTPANAAFPFRFAAAAQDHAAAAVAAPAQNPLPPQIQRDAETLDQALNGVRTRHQQRINELVTRNSGPHNPLHSLSGTGILTLNPEQHGLVPAPPREDGQPGGGNFVLLQPMAGLASQPILAQLPLGWQLPGSMQPPAQAQMQALPNAAPHVPSESSTSTNQIRPPRSANGDLPQLPAADLTSDRFHEVMQHFRRDHLAAGREVEAAFKQVTDAMSHWTDICGHWSSYVESYSRSMNGQRENDGRAPAIDTSTRQSSQRDAADAAEAGTQALSPETPSGVAAASSSAVSVSSASDGNGKHKTSVEDDQSSSSTEEGSEHVGLVDQDT